MALSAPITPSVPRPRRFRLASRAALKRIAILLLLLALLLLWCWWAMIRMPGASHRGPLPALTDQESALAATLRADVTHLSSDIGKRSTFHPRELAESVFWAKNELASAGYDVKDHSFVSRGTTTPNLEATLPGTSAPTEIIIVGAHIDSYQGTPGADDNASGVAGVLALARSMAGTPRPRTIRFVIFINEEPPAFQTADMGSWVYAKACRAAGDNIIAMLSLESIGYYSDQEGSQHYPPPLNLAYPDTGNFIGFVGNYGSRDLVRRCIGSFRSHTPFPSEGAALPGLVPGVGWSDHWSFYKEGYPAVMVTCTAPFRNPNYHKPEDTPEKLDYERMARVVNGLERVIESIAADVEP